MCYWGPFLFDETENKYETLSQCSQQKKCHLQGDGWARRRRRGPLNNLVKRAHHLSLSSLSHSSINKFGPLFCGAEMWLRRTDGLAMVKKKLCHFSLADFLDGRYEDWWDGEEISSAGQRKTKSISRHTTCTHGTALTSKRLSKKRTCLRTTTHRAHLKVSEINRENENDIRMARTDFLFPFSQFARAENVRGPIKRKKKKKSRSVKVIGFHYYRKGKGGRQQLNGKDLQFQFASRRRKRSVFSYPEKKAVIPTKNNRKE